MRRTLDFIVIGAQKAGTTTLWQHLRHHPRIAMPALKEEPFFCSVEAERPGAFEAYMDTHFGGAPQDALLGKATPHYTMGQGTVGVDGVAERIAAKLPDVRLIALLRDPIERAASQHRMSVRRGWEKRALAEALDEALDPAALEEGRRRPTETNSYLIQGEYGRILGVYRARFPVERIQVELSEDLSHDPGGVLDRVLAFLALPTGYRPPRLGARHHRGGTHKLLDTESRVELHEFLAEQVWPRLGDEVAQVRRKFNAFMEIWDIAPEAEPSRLPRPLRARLEAHYEADAQSLAALNIPAPWIESWRGVEAP